jgi:dUTP pyrophosphatase
MSVETSVSSVLIFTRIHPLAKVPTRATPWAAGYDLYSVEDVEIEKMSTKVVSTGLKIVVAPGAYGRIATRSSLAIKGVEVGAGVIDSDYRGEVKVVLHNLSPSTPATIKSGDRIAQLIILPILTPTTHEVPLDQFDVTFPTGRGVGGFGSTGV